MTTTKKFKNRVCVIGLDGVPFGLLEHLARTGVMSSLGRIIDAGQLHRMKASPRDLLGQLDQLHDGTNPGTHGIFGSPTSRFQSYEIRFPNFNDVKAPVFWDILAEKVRPLGRHQSALDLPRPADQRRPDLRFRGRDLSRAVWPLELKDELEQTGYQIDIDTIKSRGIPAFWQDLIKPSWDGKRP